MQQSLENVISKLQKVYQLKSMELENICEELELRKIATALANFKTSNEISTYDTEKIKTFLSKTSSTFSLEDVVLACTVVDLASPLVKQSKRYLEASKLLADVKKHADLYVEAKDDLFLRQTNCESQLHTMERLFQVLTNKFVVNDEELQLFINLLESEIFKDDKYSVLVVVAALVMRNANLLLNPEKITKEEPEEEPKLLSDKLIEKKEKYLEYLNEEGKKYDDTYRGMVTSTYLKNIEHLIERNKISFDEAKKMLSSEDNLYEFFLWNWMNNLLGRFDSLKEEKDIRSLFSQIDSVKDKYEDLLQRKKISDLVKNKIRGSKKIVYLNDEENYFNPKRVTKESVEIINRIKLGKELETKNDITLENDVHMLTGETEFVLYKHLKNNNILIIYSGKLENLNSELDVANIKRLTDINIFKQLDKIITDNEDEYKRLLDEAKKIEDSFPKEDNE